MKWIESVIETTSAGVEPVTGLLLNAGIHGMQIDDEAEMQAFIRDNPKQWDYVDDSLLQSPNPVVRVIFYISDQPAGYDTLQAVRRGLTALKDACPETGLLRLSTQNVDDETWVNSWKQYYKPFTTGKKLLIKPCWEEADADSGRIILEIEPGHVFGTGLHQSTKLCLEMMEYWDFQNRPVLDLGCGSGILSIAALLLGAQTALAVDMDPDAEDIVQKNGKMNGLGPDRLQTLTGDILTDEQSRQKIHRTRYGLILTNIVADVIMQLPETVKACLEPQGIWITSGIIDTRAEEVRNCLQQSGLVIEKTMEMDGWVSLACSLEGGLHA